MAAQRETRAAKKAATRERLLLAAERIARREGFDRITLDRVAESAGLTKGAVYSNFASKEEFLMAVAERFIGDLNLGLPETAPDLATVLGYTAAEVGRMAKSRPKEVVVLFEFMANALRDARLRRAVAAEVDRQDAVLADGDAASAWLDAHRDEFPLPAATFFEVVNALAMGVLLRRMVYGAERLPDDAVAWAFGRLAGDPVRPTE